MRRQVSSQVTGWGRAALMCAAAVVAAAGSVGCTQQEHQAVSPRSEADPDRFADSPFHPDRQDTHLFDPLDEDLCRDLRHVANDWYGNVIRVMDVRDALAEIRAEYRDKISREYQEMLDMALSAANTNDIELNSLAHSCEADFNIGMATEPT